MMFEGLGKLIDPRGAFDDRFVVYATLAIAGLLTLTPIVIAALARTGKIKGAIVDDLWTRYKSWLILAPLMIGPVLLGATCTIIATGMLSLVCYREYARATGLFRERSISAIVVAGILLVTFSSLDNWYGLFAGLFPLISGTIAAVAILRDCPKGYLQRVSLGILGFILFGVCLAHIGYFANHQRYRQILVWILLCVEINDVFAYLCGKSFGRRKLAPNTSPNKTVGGAVGALVLTSMLAAVLARMVFHDTPLENWKHAILMGIAISVLGQLGDLLLSSVKRDIGIKDMAATIPGHGGWLDRFNSLLLVAPAIFHYAKYFLDSEWNQRIRVFSNPG